MYLINKNILNIKVVINMSLPKLTALLAEQIDDGSQGEFGSIIKKKIKNVKEKNVPYIVFLVFDLCLDSIYFDIDKKFNNDALYDYYYFGNNSAAASQYYLTRETDSLKYLLSSTFSDLYNILKKNNLEDEELGLIIKNMENKEMIKISDKKGGGSVNFNKLKLSILQENKAGNIKFEGKSIVIGDKKYNADSFMRLFIRDTNKTNKFVLIVPKVILENGEEVILPKHKDYLKLVKIENKLGEIKEDIQGEKKICYICKKKGTDVSSNYTTNFDRTGINKIFTTTTKNTSQYLNNFNYDYNYSICSKCYQKLKSGEKIISEQFQAEIAGESAFIIPEAILANFDYKYLNYLKKYVDLVFSGEDLYSWIKEIDSEAWDNEIKQYCANFIIYRTDGNSVTVMETIEDVPTLRLDLIASTLKNNSIFLEEKKYSVSLGYIYKMIPVKVNKNGVQLDVGRVLSFYKAILSGEKIRYKLLFEYACEAMDKGLKQLGKDRIDNYFNLGLTNYVNGYEDFFIKRITMSYIILIRTLQDLGLLDKKVLVELEKEDNMGDFDTGFEKVNVLINDIESFLDKQGFNKAQKAMFYLGLMINRVALAQVEKNHKTKPILKKIQMQGMSQSEIMWLYNDVVEKLIQYERMSLLTEALMNRFNYYYGLEHNSWELSEHENVFYIMAGYSYLVGKKTSEDSSGALEVLSELPMDEEKVDN